MTAVTGPRWPGGPGLVSAFAIKFSDTAHTGNTVNNGLSTQSIEVPSYWSGQVTRGWLSSASMIPRHRMKVRLLLFCILVTFTRGQEEEEATRKMSPQRPSERPITEATGGKASNKVSDRGQPLAVGSLSSRQERTVRDRFQWLVVSAGQTSFSDWNSWRSEHGLLCRSGRQSPVRTRTFFFNFLSSYFLTQTNFREFQAKVSSYFPVS